MAIQHFGRYRILRELGRGSTATVLQARDPVSGRQVALKLLHPDLTAAPDFAERFNIRLASLQAFSHPAVVQLMDFGQEDDHYYVVMRHLPGGSLAERLDGQPMLVSEVVPIMQRLAEALDAAHARQIVHGALQPARVMFDLHGRCYLSDLGLAPALHAVEHGAGWLRLAPSEYLSPEQAAEGTVDGRADVYALGVMLFTMITGQLPAGFSSDGAPVPLHAAEHVPPLSPEALAHFVLPPEFNQVIARALARRPDDRFATAGALADAIRGMFVPLAVDEPQLAIPDVRLPAAAVPNDPSPAAAAPNEPLPVEAADTGAAAATAGEHAPDGHPPEPQHPPAPDAAVLDDIDDAVPEIVPLILVDDLPAVSRRINGTSLVGLSLIVIVAALAIGPWLASEGWSLFGAGLRSATPTAPAASGGSAGTDGVPVSVPATATSTPVPPSPSATMTASASPSPTPTATRTRTPRPTRTATLTASPTLTGTPTSTPTTRPTSLPAFTATSSEPTSISAPADTPVPPADTAQPTVAPDATATSDPLIGAPPATP
jgi:eukaryotic-like serine/threonine-protein kinase